MAGFWDVIGALNENFSLTGYVIIGVFAACWLGSVALNRWMRIGDPDGQSQ